MLTQYLLPMILFIAASLIAIRWRRVGRGIHVAIALVGAAYTMASLGGDGKIYSQNAGHLFVVGN